MPARNEEIHHAKEEGIIFRLLCNPVAIHGDDDGKVRAIECIEMELGEPDASGPVSYTHLDVYKRQSHTCEKGCAVLQAVEDGKIHPSRHASYVAMYNEVKDLKEWEMK